MMQSLITRHAVHVAVLTGNVEGSVLFTQPRGARPVVTTADQISEVRNTALLQQYQGMSSLMDPPLPELPTVPTRATANAFSQL